MQLRTIHWNELKPKLIGGILIAAPLIALGTYMWWILDTKRVEREEAMGITGFNNVQREVWADCRKLSSKMADVNQKLQEMDESASKRFENVWQMILPQDCKTVERIRRQALDENRR